MAQDETQRQLDELREQLEAVRRTRAATRRRREALEEQAAKLGNDAPPHITTEITDLLVKQRELDTQLGELEKRIARLALAPQSAIEVLPESGTAAPHLIPAVVDSRLQAVERGVEKALTLIGYVVERLDRSDTARTDGQRNRYWLYVCAVIALTIIALSMAIMALRVFRVV